MAGRKKTKPLSVKSRASEEVRRHWGDIEVIDAEKDLRVFIQPEDVSSAIKKNPGCCVFAQACKRQFAASKVLFLLSVAYVELPGPDGKRRVERFTLPPDMRELIENFDKGNSVATVAGFELKKPRPSLAFERQYETHLRSRGRRKQALLNGSQARAKRGSQGEGRYSKPAIVVDLEIRNGKGRVHFKNAP